MLRAKERSGSQGLPPLARLLTAGLLLAASLFASTLRGPTLAAAPEAGPSEGAVPTPAPAAPFDLSYVPAEASGVVALRPAALFSQPGVHKYALLLNGGIAAQLLALGKKAPGLGVADIEQMVFPLIFHYDPKAARGRRRNMILGPGGMIRSVKSFDWQKQFRAWLPNLAEAHHAGVTYYRIHRGFPAFGPDACLLFPDARTVVCMRERDLRRRIDQGEQWKNAQVWGDRWKDVERDLAAVTFRTANLLSEKEGDDPTEIALVKAAERLTAGIESCATLKARLWVHCRSEQGSEKWRQFLRTQAKELAAESKETTSPQKKRSPQEKALGSFGNELLSALHFTRQGSQLMVQTQSRRSYADVAELYLALFMTTQIEESDATGAEPVNK